MFLNKYVTRTNAYLSRHSTIPRNGFFIKTIARNKYEEGNKLHVHTSKDQDRKIYSIPNTTHYRHRGGDSDCCGVIDRLNEEARLGGRVLRGVDEGEAKIAGDDDRDSVRAMDVLV